MAGKARRHRDFVGAHRTIGDYVEHPGKLLHFGADRIKEPTLDTWLWCRRCERMFQVRDIRIQGGGPGGWQYCPYKECLGSAMDFWFVDDPQHKDVISDGCWPSEPNGRELGRVYPLYPSP